MPWRHRIFRAVLEGVRTLQQRAYQQGLALRAARRKKWNIQVTDAILTGRLSILFFLVITAGHLLMLYPQSDQKTMVSFASFALPSLAAVLAGAGLFLDRERDSSWARTSYATSYFVLLCGFEVVVLFGEGVPPRAQFIMPLLTVGFGGIACALLYSLRPKRSTFYLFATVAHLVAAIVVLAFIQSSLPRIAT